MQNDFFVSVYEVVRLIPYGRVTTYGAIARFLGATRSSRMVGYALNGCHSLREPVPAHRVVNRMGMLTGKIHFGHPEMMEALLKEEGIEIKNDIVQDFQKKFWDPAIELL